MAILMILDREQIHVIKKSVLKHHCEYSHFRVIPKTVALNVFNFSCLGWATAEVVMTRLVPLWVGARGVEFDWKYIQMSFDANVSLVSGFYFIHSLDLILLHVLAQIILFLYFVSWTKLS